MSPVSIARRCRLLALALLLFAATGPLVAPPAAQETAQENTETPTLPRLFLLVVGEPDLPLEVRSAAGALWAGRTDAAGRALFRLEVADDDVLSVRTPAADWTLRVEETVRNAHLDPEVALEIDLSGALEPAVDDEAPALEDLRAETETETETQTETSEAEALTPTGPCADPSRLECRLHRLRRLEAARDADDCAAARELAQTMAREMPDFVGSDTVATNLAEIHLECSLEASRAALAAADGEDARLYGEQAELLARRGLQIAEGEDGRGWCQVERSRVLAAAHDALRQPAAAAAGARRARELCPASTAPAEWEVLFRLRLHQWERAEEAAASLGEEHAVLAAFLRAWVAHNARGCDAVRALGADPPCRALPGWICRRAHIRLVLDCGDEAARARLAEDLRQALASTESATESEEILEDLAEVQYLRGELDRAAELFARLESDEGREERERGIYACRLGSTLLRAGHEAQAVAAFRRAEKLLVPGTLDHAVATNNAVVLGQRVENEISRQGLDRLAAVLGGLEDARIGIVPWRLAFENNLLDLRTRAEAESADAREGLRQLERLDPELRRHLESVRALATTDQGLALAACSIPAFTDRHDS